MIPTFDLTSWPREIDTVLARIESPRQRALLLNMRRHLLLEMSGRWREVVTPDMMAPETVFLLATPEGRLVLEGVDAVSDFYHNLWDTDPTRSAAPAIVHESEVGNDIDLTDRRVIGQSCLAGIRRGTDLVGAHGDAVDVDGWYLELYHLAYSFEYRDDGVLNGERSYSGGDSEIVPLAAEDVVTAADAALILAPYLDNPPS